LAGVSAADKAAADRITDKASQVRRRDARVRNTGSRLTTAVR
jgi:hypothetical protein